MGPRHRVILIRDGPINKFYFSQNLLALQKTSGAPFFKNLTIDKIYRLIKIKILQAT